MSLARRQALDLLKQHHSAVLQQEDGPARYSAELCRVAAVVRVRLLAAGSLTFPHTHRWSSGHPNGTGIVLDKCCVFRFGSILCGCDLFHQMSLKDEADMLQSLHSVESRCLIVRVETRVTLPALQYHGVCLNASQRFSAARSCARALVWIGTADARAA